MEKIIAVKFALFIDKNMNVWAACLKYHCADVFELYDFWFKNIHTQ